jgi:hypothetical protein
MAYMGDIHKGFFRVAIVLWLGQSFSFRALLFPGHIPQHVVHSMLDTIYKHLWQIQYEVTYEPGQDKTW